MKIVCIFNRELQVLYCQVTKRIKLYKSITECYNLITSKGEKIGFLHPLLCVRGSLLYRNVSERSMLFTSIIERCNFIAALLK